MPIFHYFVCISDILPSVEHLSRVLFFSLPPSTHFNSKFYFSFLLFQVSPIVVVSRQPSVQEDKTPIDTETDSSPHCVAALSKRPSFCTNSSTTSVDEREEEFDRGFNALDPSGKGMVGPGRFVQKERELERPMCNYI